MKRWMATLLVALSLCAKAQINTDNVLLMGRSAIAAEDYLTAIGLFNRVIEVKPFLYKPYYYRAYAKFSLDDFGGAEADLTKAIDINPYMVELYQLRGICRIRMSDFEGAEKDYSRTLDELRDDRSARFNRALCRLEQKKYDEAEADVDSIMAAAPNFYRAYPLKAQIAFERQDTTAGVKWLTTLTEREPTNTDAWSFLGRYALRQSRYARADSLLTKAITLSPRRYDDLLARALARHGMNRFGAAVDDYTRVIDLVPEHFVAHYNRGLILALVGEDNKALEDFDFVVAREPDNTLALYNRALLRRQTGDWRGAAADFTRLIRQYPTFYYGYQARAECRRKMGDVKGAISDETVVARANLDVLFAKPQRRIVKKVRKGSDHSLDHYDQLVDDAIADSTEMSFGRLLSKDLFGKVQYRTATETELPPYTLTFRQPAEEKGYRSIGFLPEAARLSSLLRDGTLSLTASTGTGSDDFEPHLTAAKQVRPTAADSLICQAISRSDDYDYGAAQSLLGRALSATTTPHGKTLIRLQTAAVCIKSATAMTETSSEETKTRQALLSLAVKNLKEALTDAGEARLYLLYNLGCAYMAQNDYDTAVETFDEALKTDGRLAEAWYNRGLAKIRLNDKTGARTDLSRAGELGLFSAYSLMRKL